MLNAAAPAADAMLQRIMADPDWIGNAPGTAWWADDGSAVLFRQKRPGEDFSDRYRLALTNEAAQPQRLAADAAPTESGAERVYDRERSYSAWIDGGNLYIKRLASGAVVAPSQTSAVDSDPVFAADGKRVLFLRDGQAHAYALDTHRVRQLADIRSGRDPQVRRFDALEAHQRRTYDTLVEDERRKRAREAHTRRERARPRPIYLGKVDIVSQHPSPDGRRIAVLVTASCSRPDNDKGDDYACRGKGREGTMPDYVTLDGYVDNRKVRRRVGREADSPQRLLLVDLDDGAVITPDLSRLEGIENDPLTDLRQSARRWHLERGADAAALEKALKPSPHRGTSAQALHWSPDGRCLAVRLHAGDFKDRWIATLDTDDLTVSDDNRTSSAALVQQHRLTDKAWINWDYNAFGWRSDSNTLWYLSEESGYSHLYVKPIKGKARALTGGEFVVREPVIDEQGGYAYLVANREHPGDYRVYRVALAGGELQPVSSLSGVSGFTLSPDARQLLLSHSTTRRHAELFLQPADGSEPARRLTHTVSEAYDSIDWIMPDIVDVPSSHVDRPIPAKLYLPRDHDPAQRYPAVIFVHGAGYTQNVHLGWPYYFREGMFHSLLADAGYIVLDMDYRASKGYGRDWRTAIYRQMGHPELEDQLDGVDYLARDYGVDPGRVGIYGGSYGGFMSLMALFRAPEAFAAGAALRPVVDWRHYNHTYTGAILNTPLLDPQAYERSSPITHAEGLESPLLIAAGMQDDNVFFQDSVLLVQRLIELQKQDFEIAIYPLDPHGFIHPAAWLDEYRRIFKLFDSSLKASD
ncbi:MAG: prolyl oligopeptidase family serine peptidase [Chromatocurvus sp.]